MSSGGLINARGQVGAEKVTKKQGFGKMTLLGEKNQIGKKYKA